MEQAEIKELAKAISGECHVTIRSVADLFEEYDPDIVQAAFGQLRKQEKSGYRVNNRFGLLKTILDSGEVVLPPQYSYSIPRCPHCQARHTERWNCQKVEAKR